LSELDNISIESLDADAEGILRGYSQGLRDTNIPKNHANARDKLNETSSPTVQNNNYFNGENKPTNAQPIYKILDNVQPS
jgi:hypothetical protein